MFQSMGFGIIIKDLYCAVISNALDNFFLTVTMTFYYKYTMIKYLKIKIIQSIISLQNSVFNIKTGKN